MMSRPSLLAVTSELPWPLSSGGHLRTYHLLVSLARRFDVRLVVPSRPDEADARAALARAGVAVRAVEIGPRRALVEACRIAGAAVRRDPYVLYARHRRRSVFRAVCQEALLSPPQVVYLDHLDSLLYAEAAGAAPVVIDMHNVYSTLAERAAREASGYARRRYLAGEAGLLQRKEVDATRLAHTIFACSEDEASFFRNLGARSVVVVPNGVDTQSYPWPPVAPASAGLYPDTPPTVLFIGALEWQPNVSAVGFLAREVMPAVRARVPKARLLIVGRRPSAEVLALADGPRVEIAADVPDVRPYWGRADVLAVPLETGGGTRIKILEAFAAGVPVVSSPVGCEGIAARDGEHLFVASRDVFADAVTAALIDRDGASAKARAARALVEREYDWWAIGRRAAGRVLSAAGYGPRGVVRQSAAAVQEEASA